EAHRRSFAMAVDAGVRIAMGTDAGVGPHGDNLRELGLMGAGGMPPASVLRAATSDAARLIGVGDRLGAIEAGKLADLVVVGGDPYDLESISKHIEQVW